MVRKRINLPNISGLTPSIVSDRKKQTDISIQQFLELHDSFFKQKSLEGLAPRTLRDHEIHMLYFKKYLISDNRSKLTVVLTLTYLEAIYPIWRMKKD